MGGGGGVGFMPEASHPYQPLVKPPSKVVQERLGHANIAITLDTYSHAVPALEEQAARTVAALVFGQ
jgi:integrase